MLTTEVTVTDLKSDCYESWSTNATGKLLASQDKVIFQLWNKVSQK